MSRVLPPFVEAFNPMLAELEEQVFVDARRHGIVLVRPLSRALALAILGATAFAVGWPLSLAGAALLVIAASVATLAVWRWDRTHVVLTADRLFVAHGVLRRQAAAVQLVRLGPIEIEQSLLGRLLGYGTIFAGDLEIECVTKPGELCGLVQRLSRSA